MFLYDIYLTVYFHQGKQVFFLLQVLEEEVVYENHFARQIRQ